MYSYYYNFGNCLTHSCRDVNKLKRIIYSYYYNFGNCLTHSSRKIKPSDEQKMSRDAQCLTVPYHRPSPAPPLQPLALPGGHTGGLQLLSDQALFWPVLHLLQPTQSLLALHVSTAKTRKLISMCVSNYFCHICRYFPTISTG